MTMTQGLSDRMQKSLQSEDRASATRGGIGRNTSIKPRSSSPLSINAKSLMRTHSRGDDKNCQSKYINHHK